MLKILTLALFGAAVFGREETYEEYGLRMGYIGNQGNWEGKINEDWRGIPMSDLVRTKLGAKLDIHSRNPPMKPDYMYEEEKDLGTPYSGNWAIWNGPDAAICNATFLHVKDQANCGSCWAVSATSVFAERACIVNAEALGLGFGKIEFSAEHLMSCCDWCGNGCEGGYPIDAMRYFKYSGDCSGGPYGSHCGCQPYGVSPCPDNNCNGGLAQTPACSENCRPGYPLATCKQDSHFMSDAYQLPNSCTKLQDEIYNHGSIECAFTVHKSFFYYTNGIYDQCTGAVDGGHAVTIQGWGTANNIKFWWIKNSWNASWGINGWFKFKRCVDLCGMEEQCVAGIPKKNPSNLALVCGSN